MGSKGKIEMLSEGSGSFTSPQTGLKLEKSRPELPLVIRALEILNFSYQKVVNTTVSVKFYCTNLLYCYFFTGFY